MKGIPALCRIGSMVIPLAECQPEITATTWSETAVRAHDAPRSGLAWSLQVINFTERPLMPPVLLRSAK